MRCGPWYGRAVPVPRHLGAVCCVLVAFGLGLSVPPRGAGAAPRNPRPVAVVAAADLQYALRDIAEAFRAVRPEIPVQLSFGSSGKFFTQITQGLRADLFFSADTRFPERLEQAGLVEPGSRRLYAVGRMVIWARNDFLAREKTSSPDPSFLTRPGVVRLAIANPVHAPYGRGALTLLEHYGLARRRTNVAWEKMQGTLETYFDFGPLRGGKPSFELILGENISHAAQLALTGTGVGILALSIAKAEAMEAAGRYWLAPLASHMRLEQAYVVLRGRNRPEVMAFYNFIASPRARAIFRRYGFLLPDEPAQ